jgi:hypothetical protein
MIGDISYERVNAGWHRYRWHWTVVAWEVRLIDGRPVTQVYGAWCRTAWGARRAAGRASIRVQRYAAPPIRIVEEGKL